MATSVAPATSTKTPVVKTATDPFNAAAQKDMFLKLLVAQLKNQDPTSPMDQKDMMAQMAQFSTVEQLTNLGQQMQALQTNSTFTQSVNLIGKRVDYLGKDGTLITGSTVTAVSSAAGVAKLVLSNGDTIEPAKVSRVS
jgi:flagellar basal-body rod modification protein FlgD